jgi:hypothetical protein
MVVFHRGRSVKSQPRPVRQQRAPAAANRNSKLRISPGCAFSQMIRCDNVINLAKYSSQQPIASIRAPSMFLEEGVWNKRADGLRLAGLPEYADVRFRHSPHSLHCSTSVANGTKRTSSRDARMSANDPFETMDEMTALPMLLS